MTLVVHNFVHFRSSHVRLQRLIFKTMSFKNMQRKKNLFFQKFTLEYPLNGDCSRTVNHDSYRLPVSDSNDRTAKLVHGNFVHGRKVLCTPANLSRQVYFCQPIDPLTSFDFFTSVVRIAIILQEATLSSFQRSSLYL